MEFRRVLFRSSSQGNTQSRAATPAIDHNRDSYSNKSFPCVTPPFHHSNTPPLHYSSTPFLQIGSKTRKAVPLPDSLSTSILPRWASTIILEWNIPMPIPFFLVV